MIHRKSSNISEDYGMQYCDSPASEINNFRRNRTTNFELNAYMGNGGIIDEYDEFSVNNNGKVLICIQ